MGYRQYFYEVDKSIVEGIRKCKTEEELYDFCIKNGIKCDKYEYDGEVEYYLPVYKLGKEIFEFGKYYENSDEINSYDLAEQAMVIRNSMVYPKISYDLTVIDLSSIEDYQFMNFKVGDKIKIENKEMFLEYNHLLDNFLVIAGIKYNLRNLGDTQLIINKDNEDEYLLQKLFLGLLK